MFARPTASRPARRGSPRPRPARPAVEALEERWVPATILVTNIADAGPGSLRQAILQAEAGGGGDTITLVPTLPGKVIQLASSLPTLTRGETITGPGPAALMVNGNGAVRIFTAASPTLATISGLTIQGGNSGTGDGGGVLNTGQLVLSNV